MRNQDMRNRNMGYRDVRNREDTKGTNDAPEMKRRERFKRPTDRQAASISTKRALLMLAICILCLMLTKMLA